MASPSKSSIALFLLINLVLFAGTSATTCPLVSLSPLSTCGLLGVLSSCCDCFPGTVTALEAAVCLCAAVNANICVLGVSINTDVTITAYIKAKLLGCGLTVPSDYVCVKN